MLIKELLRQESIRLKLAGIEDYDFETEYLMRHTINCDRSHLIINLDSEISLSAQEKFCSLTQRRLSREPSAYITGHKEFYGIDLLVDSRVLIPRPETELLVELILDLIKEKSIDPNQLKIADIGTGSGAIAVALAAEIPGVKVYATDISLEAITVARSNVIRHCLQDKIILIRGDLFDPLPENVDIIVSNPPYIPTHTVGKLAREIHEYEPRVALDGDLDGMGVIRRLLAKAPDCLKTGGDLFVEIGHGQADKVRFMAQKWWYGNNIHFHQDLSGIDRVLAISNIPTTSTATL